MSTKTPGSSNARPGGIFGAQRGGPQNVGQFKDPAGAAKRPASTKQPSMKSFFGGGGGGAAAATTAAATDKPELVGAPKPTVLAPSTSARAATTGREKERERAGWDRERERERERAKRCGAE